MDTFQIEFCVTGYFSTAFTNVWRRVHLLFIIENLCTFNFRHLKNRQKLLMEKIYDLRYIAVSYLTKYYFLIIFSCIYKLRLKSLYGNSEGLKKS